MAELRNTPEAERLHKLVQEAKTAKRNVKDRWGLDPVRKGFLRGHVINLNQWEEPCEYGTLQVMEFELREKRAEPGIPVRMAGTYFNNRLHEGTVMDVPDPTPDIRPITPDKIYFAHNARTDDVQAFYPGRRAVPQRRTLVYALLATTIPLAIAIVLIAILHWVLHVF